MADALTVEHLNVRFDSTDILRDLSFRVEKGSSLGVIGPNGCGKTVLFRALIGAVPYSGAVRWEPSVRIGYVPQKLDIERDMPVTGRDFLLARVKVARVDPAEIPRVLDLVGISRQAAAKPIGALSGGQFQRLLIAFALLGDPTVLLLDEPTAGVDEPGQRQLNELVSRLQAERKLSVLFISHELSVVYQYAANVLASGAARLHASGSRARF